MKAAITEQLALSVLKMGDSGYGVYLNQDDSSGVRIGFARREVDAITDALKALSSAVAALEGSGQRESLESLSRDFLSERGNALNEQLLLSLFLQYVKERR